MREIYRRFSISPWCCLWVLLLAGSVRGAPPDGLSLLDAVPDGRSNVSATPAEAPRSDTPSLRVKLPTLQFRLFFGRDDTRFLACFGMDLMNYLATPAGRATLTEIRSGRGQMRSLANQLLKQSERFFTFSAVPDAQDRAVVSVPVTLHIEYHAETLETVVRQIIDTMFMKMSLDEVVRLDQRIRHRAAPLLLLKDSHPEMAQRIFELVRKYEMETANSEYKLLLKELIPAAHRYYRDKMVAHLRAVMAASGFKQTQLEIVTHRRLDYGYLEVVARDENTRKSLPIYRKSNRELSQLVLNTTRRLDNVLTGALTAGLPQVDPELQQKALAAFTQIDEQLSLRLKESAIKTRNYLTGFQRQMEKTRRQTRAGSPAATPQATEALLRRSGGVRP